MDVFSLVARLTLDKSQYEQGLSDASDSAKSFGDRLKGGLATAAKVGTVAVTAVATAATAMTKAVIDGTSEVAAFGDNIDKASQKLGISAEAYQEWDAVLQHSGTSIDSMSVGMKTLANAAATGNDAFTKLGISQKEAASMSREELFSKTITALQNVTDENERARLAQELFGRSAMELGPLLNTSAADTQAMKDRVHELGGVMSNDAVKAAAAYQDSLQDMNTAIDGAKRNLMAEFLPSITTVMDGITLLFSKGTGVVKISKGISQFVDKLSEAVPKVMDVASKIVVKLSEAIIKNLPKLIQAATKTILTLVNGIVQELPMLVSAGLQIMLELSRSIADSLPKLIPTIVNVILEIVDVLTDPANLSVLIDAAIQIILALVDGLIEALPKLIEAAPMIVINLVAALTDLAPRLLGAGIELIDSLIQGLISNMAGIANAVGQIVDVIHVGLSDLYNGVKSIVEPAFDAIKSTASEKLDAIKAAFEKNGGGIKGVVAAGWEAIKGAYTFGFSVIDKLTGGKLTELKDAFVNAFKGLADNAISWGRDLIQNFIDGIQNMWAALKQKVSDVGSLIKSFLGFSEPEEGPLSNFHTYAPDMMALFAKGITDNERLITDAIDDAFNIQPSITRNVNMTGAGPGTGQEIVVPRYDSSDTGKQSAVMMVDRTVFAQLIYMLYNEEAARIGVRLSGVNV